jgi:hypothetical protein
LELKHQLHGQGALLRQFIFKVKINHKDCIECISILFFMVFSELIINLNVMQEILVELAA